MSDSHLERARAIHRDLPVIDGHNDLPWQLRVRVDGDLRLLDVGQCNDAYSAIQVFIGRAFDLITSPDWLPSTLLMLALAVFLVKYRIEYLLSMPLFALLFVVYLRVSLKRDSSAQTPERLFKEAGLLAVVVLLVVSLVILTFVDLPFLDRLTDPHYIRLSGG